MIFLFVMYLISSFNYNNAFIKIDASAFKEKFYEMQKMNMGIFKKGDEKNTEIFKKEDEKSSEKAEEKAEKSEEKSQEKSKDETKETSEKDDNS